MGSQWQQELEPGIGLTANLKIASKAFLEIPVIVFLVLTVTVGFWLPVLAYLLLRTWLFGQGSLYMWIVFAIGLVFFLSGVGRFVVWSIRLAPYAKELRKAKGYGNKARIDLALDAWRTWSKRRSFSMLWVGLLAFYVFLPAWVALTWSAPTGTAGSDAKAHDKQVRATIERLANRGVLPTGGRKP